MGKAFLYQPCIFQPVQKKLGPGEYTEAIRRYETARASARAELEDIGNQLDDPEKAAIFRAHIDILYDDTLDAEIRAAITTDGYQEDWAIYSVFEKYIQLLGKGQDQLIRERVADFQDVKNRLLRCHAGVPDRDLGRLEDPVVIVTHDLMPSDTATLDQSKVLGLVTEVGGATCHSAIIARSYGIPLLCVPGATDLLEHGDLVIVDALDGELVVRPEETTVDLYAKKRVHWVARSEEFERYRSVIPVCTDGTRIKVELNLGSATPEELDGAKYVDGAGLFRTEFLYMGRSQPPSEDEQYELYKKVLLQFGERPVTLRTLDIGGDKTVECLKLPKEQNPFLGKRALRLCFDEPGIFKTQLRAALRASAHGNLRIMFPMVTSIDDLHKVKALFKEVQEELIAEEIAFDRRLKTGIMIEVPAIALLADHVVQKVDFASIGTNDLTQYSLAVDRMNPLVSAYYQSYHPALFRMIGTVAREFQKANKPLCVCGELAGDPLAAAVLIGLGIRELSMSISSVARIKKLICGLSLEYAEKLARRGQELSTAAEVENYLKTALKGMID